MTFLKEGKKSNFLHLMFNKFETVFLFIYEHANLQRAFLSLLFKQKLRNIKKIKIVKHLTDRSSLYIFAKQNKNSSLHLTTKLFFNNKKIFFLVQNKTILKLQIFPELKTHSEKSFLYTHNIFCVFKYYSA